MAKDYRCEPYAEGKDPFIFVSYAHTDVDKVRPIVDTLARMGLRIWYDEEGRGIPAGTTWLEFIHERLGSSAGFLGFVSQHNEFRPVVIDEMERAIERHEKESREGGEYPVTFIMLEHVTLSSFPAKARNHLHDYQCVSYKKCGGLTYRFLSALLAANWPQGAWQEPIDRVRARTELDIAGVTGVADLQASLVEEDFAHLARFEREDATHTIAARDGSAGSGESITYGFWSTSPELVDRNTVYATYLDNQWVPESMFLDPEFRSCGLEGDGVSAKRFARQSDEAYRGLLHNWQLIINRASMWNSEVFTRWYGTEGDADYRAFEKLMDEGVFVVYLMNEHGPVRDEDARRASGFGVAPGSEEMWNRYCLGSESRPGGHKVSCMRLDWDDEGNAFESAELIGYALQNFCLTTADDEYRKDALADALGIDGKDRPAFSDIWVKIRQSVLDWSAGKRQMGPAAPELDKPGKHYSREQFYKTFVVKDGTEVRQGIVDFDKPFAPELKRIVDFLYTTALPRALQIQPQIPRDSKLRPYLLEHHAAQQRLREIASDELVCAVGNFDPRKKLEGVEVPFAGSIELSLDLVEQLRHGRYGGGDQGADPVAAAWRSYMCALAEGKERSRLDQVDLYDSLRIWEKHTAFLEAASTGTLKDAAAGWGHTQAAISLLFRFEEHEIVAVYTSQGLGVYGDICPDYSSHGLNRKTYLTIDCVCSDMRSDPSADIAEGRLVEGRRSGRQEVLQHLPNALYTEIRIFEGLTKERGGDAIKKLLHRFTIIQGVMDPAEHRAGKASHIDGGDYGHK